LAGSRARRWRGATRRCGWAPLCALLLTAAALPAPAAGTSAPPDDLEILAVDANEPVRIVFSAPSPLATRTLTTADLDVRVDGQAQRGTLRRLSANDLEVAVVVDTTLDAGALRTLQSAIAELALELPQGAAMRIIDAEGDSAEPAAVPGPAIAAIRGLRVGGDDGIRGAVERAGALLDESTRSRTALFVIGRDLTGRIGAVDDRPLDSLTYLVSIADGGDVASLLGPGAAGRALAVPAADDVLAATGEVAADLRSLYLVEIPQTTPTAQTVTLAMATGDGATSGVTVDLDPGTRQPSLTDPAAGRPPPAPDDVGAVRDDGAVDGTWLPWLVLSGLLIVALAVVGLWHAVRPTGRPAGTLPVRPAAPLPEQPMSPVRPRPRRPGEKPARPQRPIAKLAPETRVALARAHLGLRRLALASRDTSDIVPDAMFRLSEARASAALDGHDHTLGMVLLSLVTGDGDPGAALVRRAADALSTGWQHTERRRSAPPAVVEINALLHGQTANGHDRQGRPVTPVRALNPLVEIGLEHMVLAAQSEQDAGMVARAVTAVDIMRAARLARPVLTISPYLLSDAERYRAACAADPTADTERDDWLQFLCDAITRRSHVSVEQLNRLRRIRGRYRDAAADLHASRLVDVLLGCPMVDTALIARHLAIPGDHAEQVAATARQAGWLAPHPGDDRVWVADDVFDVFASTADVTTETHQPV
jgi:hypothetical protein